MAKNITVKQLTKAWESSPREVKREGQIFLISGLAEYKKIAVQPPLWKIGQSGGGIPVASGNLRELHTTQIKGLSGSFGLTKSNLKQVKYAGCVHGGTYKMEARPWLDFAKQKGDRAVKQHYRVFMNNILEYIAT